MRLLDQHVHVRARWRVLALMVTTLVLAVSASATAASFSASLKAPNHSPVVGKNWPVTVYVTRGKAKLSGSVRYQFLFGGQVVSSQPGHSFKHGVYHDNLVFPSRSVGVPLVLRVVVKTRYGTDDLDWAVTVRRH